MAQQTVENKNNNHEHMFKNNGDMFKSAMDMGVRFQQDAFKYMTGTCDTGCSMDSFRNRAEGVAMDSFNWVRKNAEMTQKMVDDTCRHGMDMVRKTAEISRNDNMDFFARAREFNQNMIDTARANMDIFSKMTTQAMETCADFMHKTMTTTEKKAGK